MLDELSLNFAVGLGSTAIIFFGVQLRGSFAYFWLNCMCTLSNGIGTWWPGVGTGSLEPGGWLHEQIAGSVRRSGSCVLMVTETSRACRRYLYLRRHTSPLPIGTHSPPAHGPPPVIAYMVAAFCPTLDVANAAVPTLLAIMLFLSGFLIR